MTRVNKCPISLRANTQYFCSRWKRLFNLNLHPSLPAGKSFRYSLSCTLSGNILDGVAKGKSHLFRYSSPGNVTPGVLHRSCVQMCMFSHMNYMSSPMQQPEDSYPNNTAICIMQWTPSYIIFYISYLLHNISLWIYSRAHCVRSFVTDILSWQHKRSHFKTI
jgi:hypothetical protein